MECSYPGMFYSWSIIGFTGCETDLSFVRLGLEKVVMFKRVTQFDAENYTISVFLFIGRANVTISVFDKAVTVED